MEEITGMHIGLIGATKLGGERLKRIAPEVAEMVIVVRP